MKRKVPLTFAHMSSDAYAPTEALHLHCAATTQIYEYQLASVEHATLSTKSLSHTRAKLFFRYINTLGVFFFNVE